MSGGKERSSDTFFAGLLSGWYVFGERNAVNEQVRPVALISSIKHPKMLMYLLPPAQIVLYVVSRVVTSFLPRAGPPSPPSALPPPSGAGSRSTLPPPPGAPYARPRPPDSRVFGLYAAVTWGAVMYLFKERRDTLQGGMVNSMQVILSPCMLFRSQRELMSPASQYLYVDSEVWSSLRNLVWRALRPCELTIPTTLTCSQIIDNQ